MARTKGRNAAPTASRTLRRSTRSARRNDDVVPDVYREMLAEAANSSPMRSDGEGRTVKRRRVGERTSRDSTQRLEDSGPSLTEPQQDLEDEAYLDALFEDAEDGRQQQIIYDDFMESDDDDDEFEDVDLDAAPEPPASDGNKDLNISLRPVKAEKVATTPRRKPVSAAERKFRMDVHKAHVICLLAHLKSRNEWCNDPDVQATLKPLLSRKTINLLHTDENQAQFQRDQYWLQGIQDCCRIWKDEFEVTTSGLRRAWWMDVPQKDADPLMDNSDTLVDKDDFKQAARTRSGSRDIGAQLFCALLRSIAVDARLVFSLQPLPFSGVAKGMAPEKSKPQLINASEIARFRSHQSPSPVASPPDFSNPRRRLGHPQLSTPSAPARSQIATPSRKRIVDSPYPIFWVEAFNEATQKWVPIDPVVRHTINKPKTGFEPPASDRLNSMSYVVGFEEDYTARDVTLRYARHYNAKTRKMRVESTKHGQGWWQKTMSSFAKLISEARDEIEDAELAAREAAEEMPRNIQDFKDHPRYVLERHLRRNEAIWPLNEVGRVSPGMSKDAKLESIYRRSDVHVVRSAEQWYRKGRDVKPGEQPLKRVIPKRIRAQQADDLEEEDEELHEGARLYAEFQTEAYVPPPVVKGRVPKNGYGNIDVYVPSMIPPGGIHVQHPEAARAAKTLGIDYADAVIGFEFKGRQGTAIVRGVVISAEYQEAIVEVLRSLNDAKARALERARTLEALTMWKKFLTGLRIKERVKEYEDEEPAEKQTEQADDSQDEDYDDSGGGFFADNSGGGFIAEPTAKTNLSGVDETGGGFDVPHEQMQTRSSHQPPSTDPDISGWRMSEVDLNAGIIITESPHDQILAPPQSEPLPSINSTAKARTSPRSSDLHPPSAAEHTLPIKPQTASPPSTDPAPPDPPTTVTTVARQFPEEKEEELEESGGGFLIPSNQENDDNTATTHLSPPRTITRKSSPTTSSESSEIEKGSLLSQDPEDEDAEPDWLEEGLGD